ncbi:hypothetical protein [Alkalihalophilus marmarensis]|uniref:Uncharacterized protein n=1 Tax=Alkalihalophilus marmarensis DSM 21297 TaxID=1188261 RepID=U6SHS8_9BACI|nr:hypothetical protein [Alkalihalophilus marmarensis]ERN51128.1 hypothetical protein A33I_20935 [Alkalihalophilus marmarensis DSM 21297]
MVIILGEKNDGKYLREFVDKIRNVGVNVDIIIVDIVYFERENICFINEYKMEFVLKFYFLVINGLCKNDEFEFNKDVGIYMCKVGYLVI